MIVLSDADRVVMWWAMVEKLISPKCAPDPGGKMHDADGAYRTPTDDELREVAANRLRAAFVTADAIVAEYERRGAETPGGHGRNPLVILRLDADAFPPAESPIGHVPLLVEGWR